MHVVSCQFVFASNFPTDSILTKFLRSVASPPVLFSSPLYLHVLWLLPLNLFAALLYVSPIPKFLFANCQSCVVANELLPFPTVQVFLPTPSCCLLFVADMLLKRLCQSQPYSLCMRQMFLVLFCVSPPVPQLLFAMDLSALT